MDRRSETRARTGVPTEQTRYPLEPLAQRMGLSLHKMCEELRISGSTAQDYRRRGVTEAVADRLAGRAGLVAYEIWPEMLDAAVEAVTSVCALPGCGTTFIPYRSNARYCSRTCGQRARRRAWQARKAATDPAWLERRRQERRNYYAECGDYERAQQRRRDAAKRNNRGAVA